MEVHLDKQVRVSEQGDQVNRDLVSGIWKVSPTATRASEKERLRQGDGRVVETLLHEEARRPEREPLSCPVERRVASMWPSRWPGTQIMAQFPSTYGPP